MQDELHDLQSKSLEKEQEFLDNSTIFKEKFDQNQTEISLMQQRYEETQQNLLDQLDQAKESEHKEQAQKKRLEEMVENLQSKNQQLQVKIKALQESKTQHENMINILSSKDMDDSDLSEANKVLENELQSSKHTNKQKDEVG